MCFNFKANLVIVVVSMSLVKEDGVASNGVMMQMGGNVERFSGDENFDENDVASNSSGVVRKIGTWKIKYLSVQGLPKSGPRPCYGFVNTIKMIRDLFFVARGRKIQAWSARDRVLVISFYCITGGSRI